LAKILSMDDKKFASNFRKPESKSESSSALCEEVSGEATGDSGAAATGAGAETSLISTGTAATGGTAAGDAQREDTGDDGAE
jgi:hypothetical protein